MGIFANERVMINQHDVKIFQIFELKLVSANEFRDVELEPRFQAVNNFRFQREFFPNDV